MQLKQAERVTTRVDVIATKLIEVVNENLYNINLIKECKPEVFPDIKQLEGQWRETTKNKIEVVKKLSKLDHASYWKFLVKPYSQQWLYVV